MVNVDAYEEGEDHKKTQNLLF